MELAAHLRGLTAYLGWILGSDPTSATFLAKWPGVSHLGWSRGLSLPQFLLLSTVNNNAADSLGLGDEQITFVKCRTLGTQGRVFGCLFEAHSGDWRWKSLQVLPETGRQRSWIKLTRSSGLDEILEEAVICVFICIYLHKKLLIASFAFRMIALLGVPEPLLLLGSYEESHEGEGACQRSHPWGEVHTQPPTRAPHPGHHPHGQATLAPLPLLLWAPNAKQCYGNTDVSKINMNKIITAGCLELFLQCAQSPESPVRLAGLLGWPVTEWQSWGLASHLQRLSITTPSGHSSFDLLLLCGRGT